MTLFFLVVMWGTRS